MMNNNGVNLSQIVVTSKYGSSSSSVSQRISSQTQLDESTKENGSSSGCVRDLADKLERLKVCVENKRTQMDLDFLNSCHALANLNRNLTGDDESLGANVLQLIDQIHEHLLLVKMTPLKFKSIESFVVVSFEYLVRLAETSLVSTLAVAVISLLNRLNNLFESKLAFDVDAERDSLKKCVKHCVRLLETLTEAKMTVLVWRIISRVVIRCKLLALIDDNDDDESQRVALIRQLFNILCANQKLNLNFIKKTLYQDLQTSSASNTQQQQQHQSSQMLVVGSQITLRNNIYQDTAKVIKLNSFMFKIFKTFLKTYMNDLLSVEESAQSILSQLSLLMCQINSILSCEQTHLTEFETEEDVKNYTQPESKTFTLLKADFVKEYNPNYEPVLEQMLAEPKFIEYLTGCSLESLLVPADFCTTQKSQSTQSIDKQLVEDLTLFYAVCLGKCMNESLLDRLTTLVDYSMVSLHVHAVLYSSGEQRLEFYDFLVVLVAKYLLACSTPDSAIYYMLNRIVEEEHSLSSQVYSDAFLNFVKQLTAKSKHSQVMRLVRLLASVYELKTRNRLLKTLLAQVLQMISSIRALNMENFFIESKMFFSYALFLSSSSGATMNVNKTQELSFKVNCYGRLIDLIDQFQTLFQEKSRSVNEKQWLRKVIAFVYGKKFLQLVRLVNELLLSGSAAVGENIPSTKTNLHAELMKKLIDFLRQDQIDPCLEQLIDNQGNSQLRELLDIILNMLQVCSTLSVHHSFSQTDLLFMVNFYLKHVGKSSSALLMKYQAARFLSLLVKHEIAARQVEERIIDLFVSLMTGVLNNETDNENLFAFYLLECLNEYSKANNSNNKIFCQLARWPQDKRIGALVVAYLVDVKVNANLADLVANMSQQIRSRIRNEQNEQKDATLLFGPKSFGSLDETMNVIMNAMDMSKTGNGDECETNNYSEFDDDDCDENRVKYDKLETDLMELIQSYESQQLPKWLKSRLQNLNNIITNLI